MEATGALLSIDNINEESTVIAIIDNVPLAIENCENEIMRKINMGTAISRAESIENLVLDEIIQMEAKNMNLFASDEEVDYFIDNQKNIIYNDSDAYAEFSSFCKGMSIAENEYWDIFYEEYREIIVRDKLITELYDQHMESMLRDRLSDLNYTLSEEEFSELKTKELNYNHPQVKNSFVEYYHNSYKNDLFEKYDVEVLLK